MSTFSIKEDPAWEQWYRTITKKWLESSKHHQVNRDMSDFITPEKDWYLCDNPLALFIARSHEKLEQQGAGCVDLAEGVYGSEDYWEDQSEGQTYAPQADTYLGWSEELGWFVFKDIGRCVHLYMYTEYPLTDKWARTKENPSAENPYRPPEKIIDDLLEDK